MNGILYGPSTRHCLGAFRQQVKFQEEVIKQDFDCIVSPFFGFGDMCLYREGKGLAKFSQRPFFGCESNPLIVAALHSIVKKTSKTYSDLISNGWKLQHMNPEELAGWVVNKHEMIDNNYSLSVLYNRLINLRFNYRHFRLIKQIFSIILEIHSAKPTMTTMEVCDLYSKIFEREMIRLFKRSLSGYALSDNSYDKIASQTFILLSQNIEIAVFVLLAGSNKPRFSQNIKTQRLVNNYYWDESYSGKQKKLNVAKNIRSMETLRSLFNSRGIPQIARARFFQECFQLLNGGFHRELYYNFLSSGVTNTFHNMYKNVLYFVDPPEPNLKKISDAKFVRWKERTKSASTIICDTVEESYAVAANYDAAQTRLEKKSGYSLLTRWSYKKYVSLCDNLIKFYENSKHKKSTTIMVFVRTVTKIDELFLERGFTIRHLITSRKEKYSCYILASEQNE